MSEHRQQAIRALENANTTPADEHAVEQYHLGRASAHAILAVADQIEQLVKLQRAYLEHFGIDLSE